MVRAWARNVLAGNQKQGMGCKMFYSRRFASDSVHNYIIFTPNMNVMILAPATAMHSSM